MLRKYCLAAATMLVVSPAWAIFTNGGFETGDFSGWTITTGTNNGLTGSPPFTGANVVITPGGSNVSAVVGVGTDPQAPQLVLPRAGSFTARVNDSNSGAIINSIKQSAPITSADIDPADSNLHVRFSYAAVLEDPGHAPADQPYFYVRIRDVTLGTVIFEDFTYSGQPGKTFVTTGSWKSSPNFINQDVIVPLSSLGHTIEIEALAADCSLGAHGGYVYLDGFGSSVVPPGGGGVVFTPALVPTMSEWGLIMLSCLLMVAAAVTRRKKN